MQTAAVTRFQRRGVGGRGGEFGVFCFSLPPSYFPSLFCFAEPLAWLCAREPHRWLWRAAVLPLAFSWPWLYCAAAAAASAGCSLPLRGCPGWGCLAAGVSFFLSSSSFAIKPKSPNRRVKDSLNGWEIFLLLVSSPQSQTHVWYMEMLKPAWCGSFTLSSSGDWLQKWIRFLARVEKLRGGKVAPLCNCCTDAAVPCTAGRWAGAEFGGCSSAHLLYRGLRASAADSAMQ